MMRPRARVRLWLVPLIVAAAQCTPPPVTTSVSSLAGLQALADSGKEMPRPHLPAGADTNLAMNYYQWGTRLGVDADTAEMSLYWASRLDPSWAEPLFARFLNAVKALQRDVNLTLLRTRSSRAAKRVALTPRQIAVIDSLQRIAWERNPFLFSELEFRFPEPGRYGEPINEAWWAFSKGRFAAAESLFAIALRQHPDVVSIRMFRARALFYLGRYDAAVTQLESARDTVRRSTEARLSPVLPSVEMFDYAIGIVRVQQDDFPAARAAFERALMQNLAFYWAHTRLAGSALALHDTATALAELDMAVQIEGRDPALRLYRGVVLKSAGRIREAEQDLRQAIALDPYFAEPYYWLAVSCHQQGDTATAVENYRRFLRRAPKDAPARLNAVRGISALGAMAAVDSS